MAVKLSPCLHCVVTIAASPRRHGAAQLRQLTVLEILLFVSSIVVRNSANCVMLFALCSWLSPLDGIKFVYRSMSTALASHQVQMALRLQQPAVGVPWLK